MEMESQALTTCAVVADGKAISIGFLDSAGMPAAINLSVEQVSSLAMTLPMLIEKALRTRYADNSLRYSYPLGSWAFEKSSDLETSLITLRTVDGFSVCFSMRPAQKDGLGEAFTTDVRVVERLPN